MAVGYGPPYNLRLPSKAMRPHLIPSLMLLVAGMASVGLSADRRYAIVLHNSNANRSFTLTELRALFSGAVARWPNHETVVLVERESVDSATRYLISRLLSTTDAEYHRRLAGIEFMGEDGAVLKTLHSDEAACQFVFNVPGAIALIDASSLDKPPCKRVRLAGVSGHLPAEEAYPLK